MSSTPFTLKNQVLARDSLSTDNLAQELVLARIPLKVRVLSVLQTDTTRIPISGQDLPPRNPLETNHKEGQLQTLPEGFLVKGLLHLATLI